MKTDRADFLEKTLRTYCLDPGVALWRAVEADIFSDERIEMPVLDIGCGNGTFLNLIIGGDGGTESGNSGPGCDRQRAITGLDQDKDEVSLASQSNVYDRLVVGDARDMPFKNRVFSTVISNCVLEHIPDVEKVFESVSRCLLNDGRIYFTVPSEYFGSCLISASLFRKIRMTALSRICIRKKNRKLQHINIYSIDKWKQILKEANMEIISYRYYIPQRTAIIWDFLFSFTRFGIWKFDVGNFLSVLDRCLQKLGIRIQAVLSPLLYKGLKKYYHASGEKGAGLFIAAKKLS